MKKIIVLAVIILIMETNMLSARTRREVVDSVLPYKDKTWVCDNRNLYDRYDNNSLPLEQEFTEKIASDNNARIQSDGKDDRRGNPESNIRWPFYVGMPQVKGTGLAYAYGCMDSPEEFDLKIRSSDKYIAGARMIDHNPAIGIPLLPPGYAGYAGIDCSGLVSRLVGITDINKKWGVQNGDISYYCMQKNAAKIEPGDLLVYKTYKHVVICGDGDPNSQLTIYQATPNKYSDGEHVRRVVCESVSSRVVEEKV